MLKTVKSQKCLIKPKNKFSQHVVFARCYDVLGYANIKKIENI